MAVPLRTSVRIPGLVSTYREFVSRSDLTDVVVCTWEGRAGRPRSLRVLPDGCVDLTWDGRALRVVRPIAGPVRHPVDTLARNVGLRLRAGWAAQVLGTAISPLDPVVALADVWPQPAVASREEQLRSEASDAARRALLLDLVAGRLADTPPPDGRVLHAVADLARPGTTVQAAAAAVGLSARQLRRRFDEEVGVGPKAFQAILRFQRFLRCSGERKHRLARLAADCGYADQSHLVRDCRRLAGSTATALYTR